MTATRNPLSGDLEARLAPRIAAVLAVKVIGLALIWLLFVRDQRVTVDAHSAAAAFGLAGAPSSENRQPEGQVHGR